MAGYLGQAQPVAAGGNSVETEDLVAGAVTDAKLNSTKLNSIESGATADQTKADIDALGINAAKINNKTVETSVPSGAVFTDTIYSHPTGAGSNHIPTGGATGQYLKYSSSGVAVWAAGPTGATSGTFPFYVANGTADNIAVTSGSFPFYKSDGTQDNIGV